MQNSIYIHFLAAILRLLKIGMSQVINTCHNTDYSPSYLNNEFNFPKLFPLAANEQSALGFGCSAAEVLDLELDWTIFEAPEVSTLELNLWKHSMYAIC